jgi:hypothetical protein
MWKTGASVDEVYQSYVDDLQFGKYARSSFFFTFL